MEQGAAFTQSVDARRSQVNYAVIVNYAEKGVIRTFAYVPRTHFGGGGDHHRTTSTCKVGLLCGGGGR